MQVPLELRGSDVRALLGFAGDVAQCRDAAQLDARIESLPRLVRSDAVMVMACRDWGGDVRLEVGDHAVYQPDLLAAVARGWHEHPVLPRDLERAHPAPRRLSDFTPAREWRRTGLFNDVYRPLGMTRELAAQLAWGPVGSSCCLILHRDGRDFSERDRATMDLAALHLRAARARIAAQAPLASRLALLERGFEHTRGALIVGSGGRVLAAGDHARELLSRWFNESPAALPDDLAGWWASARDGSAPPAFEIGSGERRLRARLVAGADEDLVILSERGDGPAASELARLLPITRREADVLARLAAGRTNDGIAHDLGISRHTVVRHVERLYAKLDVRTRAAATRAALDALHD